jgi:hypothetical protein
MTLGDNFLKPFGPLEEAKDYAVQHAMNLMLVEKYLTLLL